MGSKKSSVPDAPQWQPDPNVAWSQDRLKEQYGYLMSGLTTEGGSLSGLLGDAINISPEVSRLSQQYAQAQLDPAYRQQRQDLINTLEANNQLTGSTTASALGNLSADYMSSLTGMQAQYGLADVERALNNRVQLYGMGLNTGQAVGSQALDNQQQMNQFALANYENQVAAAMMNQKQSGSLLGGGIGLYGGAIAGGLLTGGNPLGIAAGAALGGYTGYNINNNAGQSMMSGLVQAGGAYAGSKMGGRTSIYAPTTYSLNGEVARDITMEYQPLTYANTTLGQRGW